MTRISDIAVQQILLQGFDRAASGAQSRQAQLATGKIADRYSGIGASTAPLLSAEGILTRASAYQGAARSALVRLTTQENALSEIAQAIQDLRAGFVRALANGDGSTLALEIEGAAQRVLAGLNASIGGTFVFGGADGARPPVAASRLADLAGADIAALFQDGERTRLVVDNGVFVDDGPTARGFAAGILAELKTLAEGGQSVGAFAGQISDVQRAFLVDRLGALDGEVSGLFEALGINAVAQAEADRAIQRAGQRRDLAEITVSRLEDVDLASVVARLNQDRIAIEAAARALAASRELSLLNYL